MMPSTVMGSRKITIQGGSDVTNQTCLYPGVTVRPGACLGVFTFAEAERTFPRDSIVQVWRQTESLIERRGAVSRAGAMGEQQRGTQAAVHQCKEAEATNASYVCMVFRLQWNEQAAAHQHVLIS